jgi:hypothetical protein
MGKNGGQVNVMLPTRVDAGNTTVVERTHRGAALDLTLNRSRDKMQLRTACCVLCPVPTTGRRPAV